MVPEQDGAPAHTAKKTLEWLTERVGGRVISEGATISWPPRSPDLTPPDFFLWGHIKQMVYRDNPSTLTELKAAIRMAIGGVSPERCTGVMYEARHDSSCVRPEMGGVSKVEKVIAVHVRSREKLQAQALKMAPFSCMPYVLTRKYTTIKCGTNFWDTRYMREQRNSSRILVVVSDKIIKTQT